MEKETGRLHVIIREADADRKRQQKELDQVITERDILGTQLGELTLKWSTKWSLGRLDLEFNGRTSTVEALNLPEITISIRDNFQFSEEK